MSNPAGQSLSPAQREAVERSGQDVCVSAGPGSGKTFVLVERFAWLVRNGADPLKVLAITFTEKAATNIKRRLAERFEDDGEKRRAIERAPVSTIHAFCMSILREHALAAGVDPAFSILDERDAWLERQRALDVALDRAALGRRDDFRRLLDTWRYGRSVDGPLVSVYEETRMYGGPARALAALPRYDSRTCLDGVEAEVRLMLQAQLPNNTTLQKQRLAGIQQWLAERRQWEPFAWLVEFDRVMKGLQLREGHPAKEYRDKVKEELVPAAKNVIAGERTQAERQLLRDVLISFDEEFRRAKRARGALDFTDLEEYALDVLVRDANVRKSVQDRYDAVLMDELQDTNPIQWRIVDLVRRPGRFFAVGDINQSIYGFRHADPLKFEEFQAEFETRGWTVDRLETNYRSRAEILRVASAVTRLPGVRPHQLIARDAPFPPKAKPSVELQRVEGTDNEAQWVARRIRELVGRLSVGDPSRAARFSDVAILSRTTSGFPDLENALQREGVPYVLARGQNFFALQEVVDLTNWLRVLENPHDEIALYALLRSPFFGIGDEELFRGRRSTGMISAEIDSAIRDARTLREDLPNDLLLTRAIQSSGYRVALGPAEAANVDKFLALLRNMRAAGIASLAETLEQIDSLRAAGTEPAAPPSEETDAVRLMSIHSAKGLEFPVVILASLQKGAGKDELALSWSEQNALGGRWRIDGAEKAIGDPASEAEQRDRKRRQDLESDRMLYVAMTRAEEHLVLSWYQPEKRSGQHSQWPQLVEAALGPTWPAETNVAEERGDLRIVRRLGEPELAERLETAAQLVQMVELPPSMPLRQPASEIFVTALVRFESCPRRSFLGVSLRWPAERSGVSGGAELGTEVHALLAGEVLDKPSAEALRLRRTFDESELGQRAARAKRIEREFDFLLDWSGVLIAGQIDLWFEEGGEVIVVDYKVGRMAEGEKLREYERQLQIYALAVERAAGKAPSRAVLTFLQAGQMHDVDLSGRAAAVSKLVEVWQQAERIGEYPMAEGKHCESCPYFGSACPSWWEIGGPRS